MQTLMKAMRHIAENTYGQGHVEEVVANSNSVNGLTISKNTEDIIDKNTYVWVISYFDFAGGESTVTVFDNKEAAELCYETFKEKHKYCSIDMTILYHKFAVS